MNIQNLKIFYKVPLFIFLVIPFLTHPSFAESDYDKKLYEVERTVFDLPRGVLKIPAQWFEMETLIGWEKMMLILGYADNETVCNKILITAIDESPLRRFRCSPAN